MQIFSWTSYGTSVEAKEKEEIMEKKKMLFLAGLFLSGGLAAVLVTIGCASIIHGTRQEVGVSSSPTGATVTVDSQPQGKTPIVVEFKRKDKHTVRIEMEKYEPFEMALTRKVSGWVWGNILFGGVLGLAVDAITGGLYKINPEKIEATLSQGSHASFENKDGSLYLAVVLRPHPSWQRIGTLTPARR